MEIYFAIALILFITAKKNNKILFYAVCALLYIITAFRGYSVGTDTLNYEMLFTGAATSDKSGEQAFTAISLWLNERGLDYRWFLIVSAILFWGHIFVISYLNKKKMPIFTLAFVFLLGYAFMFFNISRQMIAVSIGLWVFYMIEKGVRDLYVIPVIIAASLFHTSAVILFLVFLIRRVQLSYKSIWLILLISFILPLLTPINEMVDPILYRIGLSDRFSDYLYSSNKSAFSFNRLLMNFFYGYLAYIYKSGTKDVYFSSVLFGLVILNLFPTSSFITRSGIFYLICQVVFLPRSYSQSRNGERALVWAYSFSVFISFLVSNNGGIVPYTFG